MILRVRDFILKLVAKVVFRFLLVQDWYTWQVYGERHSVFNWGVP